MSTGMKSFYFSRNCKHDPLASKWLISGVMVAPDLDGAKRQLDAALAKTSVRSTAFDWIDLATVELAPSGLAAITMGEA